MIYTRELRIGNYINLNDGSLKDDIRSIIGCNESGVFVKIRGCEKAYSYKPLSTIYPIPLSEDVLLKCGFKRIANLITGLETEIVYYQNGKIIVYLLKDFFEIEIETSSGIFNLHHTFEKHLHQLQNLYYALCGRELEVSL